MKDAYLWDPSTQVEGVSSRDVLGVEACLWSETLRTMRDIEYLVFPRLPGAAEMGWSPAAGKNWKEYSLRLGSHGARLAAMGVNYYRSKEVTWE